MSRTIIKWGTPLALLLLITACSGLQKNEALVEAESAFMEAKQDEEILRYAPTELERANDALTRAASAQNSADMNSLAYIGKTRLKTAKSVASRKAAAARVTELGEIKDQERLNARELEILVEQDAKIAALRGQDEALRAKEEAMRANAESLRMKDEALQGKETALMEREKALADAEALRLELAALQAQKTERGMVMTLGDVLFSTGKTALLPGALSTIDKLARFLAEYPEKTILIEGHTDNVGSDTFNQDLSERRAVSVKDALMQASVEEGRISTVGLGETTPMADNETSAGRLKNRRVEIVIQD